MRKYRINTEKVRVYIAEHHLSVAAFRDRTLLCCITYYSAMHGHHVTLKTVVKFANAMGCSFNDLIVDDKKHSGKKLVTNLDRIKKLTAEQMAKRMVDDMAEPCDFCVYADEHFCGRLNDTALICEQGIKLWLEQEATNEVQLS